MSSSLNQPNYLFYCIASHFIFHKDSKSYFFRINKVVTVINDNGSTYVLVFPLDNETREKVIAIRADICRKKNCITYAYVYTDDIIYNLDLSKYKQSSFWVDKVSRIHIDSYGYEYGLISNNLKSSSAVKTQLYYDDMKEIWNGKTWAMIDYSAIVPIIKLDKKLKQKYPTTKG